MIRVTNDVIHEKWKSNMKRVGKQNFWVNFLYETQNLKASTYDVNMKYKTYTWNNNMKYEKLKVKYVVLDSKYEHDINM